MKPYVVFWLDGGYPCHQGCSDLTEALNFAKDLRDQNAHHVCLSVQDPNHVGKMGVNDKLPDGYNWTKRR